MLSRKFPIVTDLAPNRRSMELGQSSVLLAGKTFRPGSQNIT